MQLPDYHKRVPRARDLRRDQTDAETRLWLQLRDRRLQGWKFRRQVPMGRFIVDFFCRDAKLFVEVDGGQHDRDRAKDEARTHALETLGFRVIRFWNNEVIENMPGVLETILIALKRR